MRARDWTGLVASGGHHFNVIKIAAAVGESHLHVGAHMCGASWDEFKRTSAASRRADARTSCGTERALMSRIVGGIGIAHTPSMGYQFDKGMHAASIRLAAVVRRHAARQGMARRAPPSHMVIIYNDHMNYFDLKTYPTFAIGMAAHFPQADEGYGLRPFPGMDGDPEFAWPIARALVRDGFDLTFCQELELDHGVYSWLPYVLDPPWPLKVLPIAVNMLMHPVPTPERLRALGRACGARCSATGANATSSCSRRAACRTRFTARVSASRTKNGTAISSTRSSTAWTSSWRSRWSKIMQVAGTEAAELSMWYTMRAALSPERARATATTRCPR